MATTLGVILAGGFSRRMGAPKQALRTVDGHTFAEAACAALLEALAIADNRVVSEILVVGPDDVLPTLPHVQDAPPPGRGPLAGIEAAFSAGAHEQLLIVPCDVPRLKGDLLQRLLEPTPHPATMFRTGEQGRVSPLPLRLHRSALSDVRTALAHERYALHALLETCSPLVIPLMEARDLNQLDSINTPEAYAAYRAAGQ